MTGQPSIRTVVVDDDPMNADAHAAYVNRVDGFVTAGIARSGGAALELLRRTAASGDGGVDLVLLDMNLPDLPGMEVCRRIRALRIPVDIIAVTAVRDVALVRDAVSYGVLVYLMKPFTFAMFSEKLGSYRAFRDGLEGTAVPTQRSVDQAISSLRRASADVLDKGLTPETLDLVARAFDGDRTVVSARELGAELGIARGTARRYLEHLVDVGVAERTARYGTPGRPEIEYRRRFGSAPATPQ
ncbi:response regulator [Curtobacterium ammoniigenes]|uniref:response regulator n=1 Tax=Curtobacterium ammoniigenes TaxID=395387 RepID=UPI00082F7915|nr:response regulator [Curtobacterium ammoniigenes]